MATLTNSDYTEIKKIIMRPAYKGVFKSWALGKTTLHALFQEMEDYFVDGFNDTPVSSIVTALAGIYPAITAQQAKAIADAWGVWKINHQ